MNYRNALELHGLIHSLTKSEKIGFHRGTRKAGTQGSLHLVLLFQLIAAMPQYDERVIRKKFPQFNAVQLSQLRWSLHHELVESLRTAQRENLFIKIHQLLDHTVLLISKGLYSSGLKAAVRLAELSRTHHQLTYELKGVDQILILARQMDLEDEEEWQSRQQLLMSELACIAGMSTQMQLMQAALRRNGSRAWQAQSELLDRARQSIVWGKHFFSMLYYYQSLCYWHQLAGLPSQAFEYGRQWFDLFLLHPGMQQSDPAAFETAAESLALLAFTVGDCSVLFQLKTQAVCNVSSWLNTLVDSLLALCGEDLSMKFEDISHLSPERQLIILHKRALYFVRHELVVELADVVQAARQIRLPYQLHLQRELALMGFEAHQSLGNDELSASLKRSAKRIF